MEEDRIPFGAPGRFLAGCPGLARFSRDTPPPGILIPYQPWQAAIGNARPWEKEGRLIYPLADFRLRARVLGKERYRFDSQADISPVDLALGWGPMSDQTILDQLDIAQSSRFFVVAAGKCHPPCPCPLFLPTAPTCT